MRDYIPYKTMNIIYHASPNLSYINHVNKKAQRTKKTGVTIVPINLTRDWTDNNFYDTINSQEKSTYVTEIKQTAISFFIWR